jgi:hypothetical protein
MSGELQVSQVPQDQTRSPLTPTVILLIILLGGFPYLAVQGARVALDLSGGPLWLRIPIWATAGLLMAIPLWFAFILLRQKIRTGRFLLDRAQIAARRAETVNKVGAGKPFWPQAGTWLIPFLVGAFLLGLGIVAIAAAIEFGRPSRGLFTTLLAAGALFLFIPSRMAFQFIRRKFKTGSYLPSDEELAAVRLRGGRLLPLWQRILFASIMLLNAGLQTYMLVGRLHSGHGIGHSLWAVPLWWVVSFYWGWQVFRPRPQGAIPPATPGD